MVSFSDAVAVVTRAGSGIGQAAAPAFAELGASVVVADVATEAGEDTVARIRSSGGDAHFAETDVSDPVAATSMVDVR